MRQPASGLWDPPLDVGQPELEFPQSTISFCIGQPEVGFGGRINGGAGQVHLTNLVANSNGTVDFTSIAALEDFNGFSGAWTVTAYAVCATPNPPANLTRASATTPASSVNKFATVSCPAGTRVHSAGGQVLTQAGSGTGDRRLVIDSVAIDPQLGSVTVRAVEDETGTGANWSVRALALCGP